MNSNPDAYVSTVEKTFLFTIAMRSCRRKSIKRTGDKLAAEEKT
jgi:hypothetical protein